MENGPQSPKSPDCNYTTTQTRVRNSARKELGTSLATLSVGDRAATSPYARRLALLDTEPGAAASESEADESEDLNDEAFASYQTSASADRYNSISQGFKENSAGAGDERPKTSSTAAVSDLRISNQLASKLC